MPLHAKFHSKKIKFNFKLTGAVQQALLCVIARAFAAY